MFEDIFVKEVTLRTMDLVSEIVDMKKRRMEGGRPSAGQDLLLSSHPTFDENASLIGLLAECRRIVSFPVVAGRWDCSSWLSLSLQLAEDAGGDVHGGLDNGCPRLPVCGASSTED